jgi:hypothetical protein
VVLIPTIQGTGPYNKDKKVNNGATATAKIRFICSRSREAGEPAAYYQTTPFPLNLPSLLASAELTNAVRFVLRVGSLSPQFFKRCEFGSSGICFVLYNVYRRTEFQERRSLGALCKCHR